MMDDLIGSSHVSNGMSGYAKRRDFLAWVGLLLLKRGTDG